MKRHTRTIAVLIPGALKFGAVLITVCPGAGLGITQDTDAVRSVLFEKGVLNRKQLVFYSVDSINNYFNLVFWK